jgi:hypothetical protein
MDASKLPASALWNSPLAGLISFFKMWISLLLSFFMVITLHYQLLLLFADTLNSYAK